MQKLTESKYYYTLPKVYFTLLTINKLTTIHSSIMAKQGRKVNLGLYHNASGDTVAVVEIVKRIDRVARGRIPASGK